MVGHELVEVAQVDADPWVLDIKGEDVCDEHERRFEFCCVEEDMPCWSVCAENQIRAFKTVCSLTKHAENAKSKW